MASCPLAFVVYRERFSGRASPAPPMHHVQHACSKQRWCKHAAISVSVSMLACSPLFSRVCCVLMCAVWARHGGGGLGGERQQLAAVYLEHAEATRALALYDQALQLFAHRAHLAGQVLRASSALAPRHELCSRWHGARALLAPACSATAAAGVESVRSRRLLACRAHGLRARVIMLAAQVGCHQGMSKGRALLSDALMADLHAQVSRLHAHVSHLDAHVCLQPDGALLKSPCSPAWCAPVVAAYQHAMRPRPPTREPP